MIKKKIIIIIMTIQTTIYHSLQGFFSLSPSQKICFFIIANTVVLSVIIDTTKLFIITISIITNTTFPELQSNHYRCSPFSSYILPYVCASLIKLS